MTTEGATRLRQDDESPKPVLVRLSRLRTAIMHLAGFTRLELEFDGGHLRRWSAHDERNGHERLRPVDARAPMLIELLVAP